MNPGPLKRSKVEKSKVDKTAELERIAPPPPKKIKPPTNRRK